MMTMMFGFSAAAARAGASSAAANTRGTNARDIGHSLWSGGTVALPRNGICSRRAGTLRDRDHRARDLLFGTAGGTPIRRSKNRHRTLAAILLARPDGGNMTAPRSAIL